MHALLGDTHQEKPVGEQGQEAGEGKARQGRV